MSKILISYRREDSADVTGRIYDRLVQQFGREAVFVDVDSMSFGVDFRKQLDEQVVRCDVFLAVIGPDWMGPRDSQGKTRLEDPGDFVRIEVESALTRQIPVIPILVRGASIPPAEQLPQSMQDLPYRHGLAVRSGHDFHRDMDLLIEALKQNIDALVDQRTELTRVAETEKEEGRPALNAEEQPSPASEGKCASVPEEKPEPVLEEKSTRISQAKPSPKPKKQTVRHLSDQSPQKLRQKAPFEMVKVPKGPFLYGAEKTRERIDYDYWIDQYPVTNEKYAAFIAAGGYINSQCWSPEGWMWKKENKVTIPSYWESTEWNRADHPVVGVSYYEVEAYANWAGKRLPTEWEWEKAARGKDGREYPWGDEFDRKVCNSKESPWRTFWVAETTPVTQYPDGVSPYGCSDMSGNVCEWCSGWYEGSGGLRVFRGGSWNLKPVFLRASHRFRGNSDGRDNFLGFRLVQDIL